MEDVRAAKRALRRRFRARRAAVPARLREAWSRAVAARAAALPEWRAADSIHLFIGALPGEIGTMALVQAALAESKALLCPRVAGTELETRHISSLDEMKPGYRGLLEPDPARCEQIAASVADLVLVPGLAFTESGGRLGMGSGFYDRLLADAAAPVVALAFELQIGGEVPTTAHDRPVDAIVTELRLIRC